MKPLVGALVGILLMPIFAFAAPVKCECVRYLREIHGINIRGDAWTQRPNIYQGKMQEGDVVILRYGKVWHVALVAGFGETEVNPNNPTTKVPKLRIIETNFVPCTPTAREISWFDEHIVGIYRPMK